jgi:hypothetical protein
MRSINKNLSICILSLLFLCFAWQSVALERVSGNKITFVWDPSDRAEGYILLFAPYPNAEYVGELDIGNWTQVTFDLWEGASFYVAVQAYNRAGKSGISNIVAFLASSEGSPRPVTLDITANGVDGLLQISSGIPVSIRVNPGLENYCGLNADCWITAESPYGWFSYVPPSGWIPGIQRYSGPGLSWLNSGEIFSMALPAGEYVFYLALDDNADTILDATWWNSVTVKVEE